MGEERGSGRLVAAGVACCVATLTLPPFGIAAVVIGVALINRSRVAPGVTILVLGLVLPLIGLVIFQAIVAKPYRIPSAAMEPTLEIGDRILVDRTGLAGVGRGDVVVFNPPRGADDNACGTPGHDAAAARQACPEPTPGESEMAFVKRIVAVGGDRLRIEGGRVVLNGERLDEPYIEPSEDCVICNLPREIRIPPDHYFMMGDNRGESADSREWGPVPEDSVVGATVLRYWPLGRFGSP
jgi:signal peptidase I